jgi:two-component system, chemotaxis family, sensor kinase CheA
VDLSKYVDLFLSEGREHAAELNGALAELERAPSSTDAIASAFRAVHSVKGMAAAMGYASVTACAESLESALDALRRGDDRVTSSLLSHLTEDADALAREIELAVSRPPSGPSDDACGDASGDASGGAGGAQLADGAPEKIAELVPEHPVEQPRQRATHVRVRASRLDSLMNLVGEIEIARGRLERELRRFSDDGVTAAFDGAARLLTELREQVIGARMVPVGQVFERFPRLVRETARSLGKEVDFTLDGSEIELDRSILDRIGDPVMHLLRNALDHGIEAAPDRERGGKPARGRLTLSAQREAGYVLIRVADDGRGIDRDRVLARAHEVGIVGWDTVELDDVTLLRVLAHPGFSTASSVTSVSGRGVGLDVVDAAVRVLGGAIEMKTIGGRGTAITLRLPLSVAIVRALIARVGEELFAVPFTHVQETLRIEPTLAALRGEEWTETAIAGSPARVVMLRTLFGHERRLLEWMPGILVLARGMRVALIVDEFVGQQDVVVKRFDPPRGGASMFAGATVLGDGSPALIVDVNSLI